MRSWKGQEIGKAKEIEKKKEKEKTLLFRLE